MAPTITGTVHIIAEEPFFEFDPKTWPSVTVSESQYGYGRATVTCSGNADQRRAFAERLREMADAVEAWEPKPEAVPA